MSNGGGVLITSGEEAPGSGKRFHSFIHSFIQPFSISFLKTYCVPSTRLSGKFNSLCQLSKRLADAEQGVSIKPGSRLTTVDIGAGSLSAMGAVPCIVGCGATNLVSAPSDASSASQRQQPKPSP